MKKPTASKQEPASINLDMRTEIASIKNDITIPFYNGVLYPQDTTILERGEGRGLALYNDIERDNHAAAVLQKRKNSLIARQWHVVPASETPEDEAAATFIEDLLKTLNFDQLCLDMLDATLKGFSISEIIWENMNGKIIPSRIKAHDQTRFVFDEFWQPRLLTYENLSKGIELPQRKFIVHRFNVKGNDPYGLGIGHRLFWPVYFKREIIKLWLYYMEKYASPSPVGKFPLGMGQQDQDRMLQNLRNLVQQSALLVPVGSEVSFLESHSTGTGRFEETVRYFDEQMSVSVMGSNLGTSIKGGGSLAAARVHQDVEAQIIDADSDLLSDTLHHTLCQWICDFNFPNANAPRIERIRPKNEAEHEAVEKARAERQKKDLDNLFDVAGRIPDQMREKTLQGFMASNLIRQVPDDQLKQLLPAFSFGAGGASGAKDDEPPPPPQKPIEFSSHAFSSPERASQEAIVEGLMNAGGKVTEAWIARVKTELEAAVEAGMSIPEFQEKLLELYEHLELDPLGNIIEAGITLADLTGQLDAQEATTKRG